jgi:hypothetical protein
MRLLNLRSNWKNVATFLPGSTWLKIGTYFDRSCATAESASKERWIKLAACASVTEPQFVAYSLISWYFRVLVVQRPELRRLRIGKAEVGGDELLFLRANVLPQQCDILIADTLRRFTAGHGRCRLSRCLGTKCNTTACQHERHDYRFSAHEYSPFRSSGQGLWHNRRPVTIRSRYAALLLNGISQMSRVRVLGFGTAHRWKQRNGRKFHVANLAKGRLGCELRTPLRFAWTGPS